VKQKKEGERVWKLIPFIIAGGGIVHDSVEEEEYQETMNKMGSNLATITQCEQKIFEQQQAES
jgi:anthranilate synthase component 1